MIELTDKEKIFLTMLFKMGDTIIKTADGYFSFDSISGFGEDDIFYLSEKLGINY